MFEALKLVLPNFDCYQSYTNTNNIFYCTKNQVRGLCVGGVGN